MTNCGKSPPPNSETNVIASDLSPDPPTAIRQFCTFARRKLRQESG